MASGVNKRNAQIDTTREAAAGAMGKQMAPTALQTQREGVYSDIITNGANSKYAQPQISQLALYKRNASERDRSGAYGFGARYADPNLLAALGKQEEGNAAESDAVNGEAMYERRFNDALSGGRADDQLTASKYGSVIGGGNAAFGAQREASPWATALTTGLSLIPAFSDVQLKHEINELPYGLKEVMELRPVDWKWNQNESYEMGLIAQEVQKVIPELVVPMNDEGTLGIKYAGLLPVALKAIQELTQRLEALEGKR